MNGSSSLRLYGVPAATIMAFVEALAANPDSDALTIAKFAGYSPSTGRKVLPSAETLGLIRRASSGTYRCAVDSVSRGMTEGHAMSVFRRALQSFRPYEAVCEGLALGESSDEAVRKACLLLGLPEGDEAKLQILLRWGAETGLLNLSNEGILTIRADLVVASEQNLGLVTADDLDSQVKARLFNSKKIGQAANNFLDEVDRELLAQALISYSAAPEVAVEAAGQALEDFLRDVARAKKLDNDAKKCSGISQLANLLHSRDILHAHHQKLVESVSAVRNAKAHKKDKLSLSPWEITREGAFATVMMTLVAIRSIYEFVFQRRQIL